MFTLQLRLITTHTPWSQWEVLDWRRRYGFPDGSTMPSPSLRHVTVEVGETWARMHFGDYLNHDVEVDVKLFAPGELVFAPAACTRMDEVSIAPSLTAERAKDLALATWMRALQETKK